MALNIANVQTTDTFQTWFTRTNQIIGAAYPDTGGTISGNLIVTGNTDPTNGNLTVTGNSSLQDVTAVDLSANSISVTKSITANTISTGTISGILTGNTSGTHTGPVVGDVRGDLTGNTLGVHTGNVVATTIFTRDLTGNTFGIHTGPSIGDVQGNVTGNTIGIHFGTVQGDITGDLTGNTTGTHIGNVSSVSITSAGTFSNTYTESIQVVTTLPSVNALSFDLSSYQNFEHTLANNITYTFANPPASGAFGFTIKVVQDAAASGYTVTWPGSVDWPETTAPTLTATASGVDMFVFVTNDNGTTYYGFTAGQALG